MGLLSDGKWGDNAIVYFHVQLVMVYIISQIDATWSLIQVLDRRTWIFWLLAHGGLDKMAVILKTTFSHYFYF